MLQYLKILGIAALATIFTSCQAEKSSSPLSPSIAGPIPGITITTPLLLEPNTGWKIETTDQPITLLIENSSSNSERPLIYAFEIATDTAFTNIVLKSDSVVEGPNGQTSILLLESLTTPGPYYWRAQAFDGANTSSYSNPVLFKIVLPTIQAPVPFSPIDGTITSIRPKLVAQNTVTGTADTNVNYLFEISTNEIFNQPIISKTISDQSGQIELVLDQNLTYDTTYFWRVQSFNAIAESLWSTTESFVTLQPDEPPPDPSPPSDGANISTVSELCAFAATLPFNALPYDPVPYRDAIILAADNPHVGLHRRPNGRISEDIVALNYPAQEQPHQAVDVVGASTGCCPTRLCLDQTVTIEPGSVFVNLE